MIEIAHSTIDPHHSSIDFLGKPHSFCGRHKTMSNNAPNVVIDATRNRLIPKKSFIVRPSSPLRFTFTRANTAINIAIYCIKSLWISWRNEPLILTSQVLPSGYLKYISPISAILFKTVYTSSFVYSLSPNPDKPEPKFCQNAQDFVVKRLTAADNEVV